MKAALVVARAPASEDERLQLIKDTYAKGTTDNEFALFIHTSRHLCLDPLAGQICLIPNWDKDLGKYVQKPCVKIDGFRSVAESTGKYRGQTPPEWCGEDGIWKEVWSGKGYPFAARAGVLREGFDRPVYAVARWATYAKKTKAGEIARAWAEMPDLMLHKCAEALALRKAFPQKLGGVYAPEEMEQVSNPDNRLTATAAGQDLYPDLMEKRALIKERTKQEGSALLRLWSQQIDAWKTLSDAMSWAYRNGWEYSHMESSTHHSSILRRILSKIEVMRKAGVIITHQQIKAELANAPEEPVYEAPFEEAEALQVQVAKEAAGQKFDEYPNSPVDEPVEETAPEDTVEPSVESDAQEETATDPESGECFLLDEPLGFGKKHPSVPLRDVPSHYAEWIRDKVEEKSHVERTVKAKARALLAWREALPKVHESGRKLRRSA